jgi:hypothetical protein
VPNYGACRRSGFVGKFDWSATLGDLRRLDTILANIYGNLGAVASFTYEPVEPSVAFVFRSTVSGHIETDYVLEARLAWGPKLVGTFTFDQSYIPSMREQLGELLASAAV